MLQLKNSLLIFLLLIMPACLFNGKRTLKKEWHYSLSQDLNVPIGRVDIGLLTYRKRVLPSSIKAISTPIGNFYYKNSTSFRGWIKESSGKNSFIQIKSNDVISTQDSRKGWYEAAYLGKKQSTPVSWIWVDFGTKKMWLKPEAVFYYAGTKPGLNRD